uniref:Secreted protein n=1 Tax=Ascaris lumbricoides TaxID=6252 RepID=A0A0M3IRV8_ASCLU
MHMRQMDYAIFCTFSYTLCADAPGVFILRRLIYSSSHSYKDASNVQKFIKILLI